MAESNKNFMSTFFRTLMSLRIKLMVILLGLLIIPSLVISVYTYRLANDSLGEAIGNDLKNIANSILYLCEAQQRVLQEKVNTSLKIAEDIWINKGGRVDIMKTLRWQALNQFTKKTTEVTLPQWNLDGNSIEKVRSFKETVPIVDEITRLTGNTCTIFQRMNEQGDLLRIATTVPTLKNERAIGTYIPAVEPDGKKNKVVRAIMSGKTYKGKAYVVNAWYVTIYRPIYNAYNEVVGVLYIGKKLKENMSRTAKKYLYRTVVRDIKIAEKIFYDAKLRITEWRADHKDIRPVEWNAINQYTKKKTLYKLPRWSLGGSVFDKVKYFNSKRTIIVDEVFNKVGGTCTIFQRMNQRGDMLRIETNVKKLDGTRAIGTYIPAINPSGLPNPVVSTVLKKETYRGRAYVVNAWYITAYKPILDEGGNVIGILYVGIKERDLESLKKSVLRYVVGKNGYATVVSAKDGAGEKKGEFIITAEKGEKFVWGANEKLKAIYTGILAKTVGTKTAQLTKFVDPRVEKRLHVASCHFDQWGWVIMATGYEDELLSKTAVLKTTVSYTFLFFVVIGIVIAFIFANSIVVPVEKLTKSANEIASGNLKQQQLEVTSSDEIGSLSHSFNKMGSQLELLVRQARAIALGNLSNPVLDQELPGEIGVSFKTMVRSLKDLIGPVTKETLSLSEHSEQIFTSMQDVKSGSLRQQSELTRISESIYELSSGTQESKATLETVQQQTQKSRSEAKRGARIVKDLLMAINTNYLSIEATSTRLTLLTESTEEIGKIVASISEIAEQTNLVALNASIEASRAGEYGQGFAVVAEEIRKLAEKSTSSAKEIEYIVTRIRGEMESTNAAMTKGINDALAGSEHAREAENSLKSIVVSADEIATAVTEVTNEISHGAAVQSQTSNELVTSIASISQQTLTLSETVVQQVQRLNNMVSVLTDVVRKFNVS